MPGPDPLQGISASPNPHLRAQGRNLAPVLESARDAKWRDVCGNRLKARGNCHEVGPGQSMGAEVGREGSPGGPDLNGSALIAFGEAAESLGGGACDRARQRDIVGATMSEGFKQPRPAHFGEHRVSGNIGLKGGLHKADDAKLAFPDLGRIRIVKNDEAAGRIGSVAEQFGCQGDRLRGQSLRRWHLDDRNVRTMPNGGQSRQHRVPKGGGYRRITHIDRLRALGACSTAPTRPEGLFLCR